MKTPAIKKLVENYSIIQLQEAELAICDEQKPNIEVEGDDEGEQLTHILASIFIKSKMGKENCSFAIGLREFSQKVRKSIS